MLTACLNGARGPQEHPRLPVTPAEMAADAAAAHAAGADDVHVHIKTADGCDTLAGRPLAEVLGAIRSAASGLPVGVTTGAWAMPDPQARVANIETWQVLPDAVSVNWHEDGAEAVARAALERGIAVEAGLWTPADVDSWLRSGLRAECTRILVELPDRADDELTARLADFMLAQLAHVALPVQLHGEGASAWPALRLARRRGLDIRAGLEDMLTLPDGTPAPDNAALIAAAAATDS